MIAIEALGDLPNASLMTALKQADQKKWYVDVQATTNFFEVVENRSRQGLAILDAQE